MRTVEVEIFNTRFSVCEYGNEHYLLTLTAEVDARIHALCAGSHNISPLRAAIMAAYQFADEAKREQGKKGSEQGKSSQRPPQRDKRVPAGQSYGNRRCAPIPATVYRQLARSCSFPFFASGNPG